MRSSFSNSSRSLPWQPILCHTGLVRLQPNYLLGSAGPIFTIFAPYGRYWIADDQSDFLFNARCNTYISRDVIYTSRSYLARSANLPTGLCILPSVISSFFLLWAKPSQYLLDRFSRSLHQMEGICVNFPNLVQFFRFLKGRCHGNQFCVVSKTQTMCNFCNFYTIWKGFGCRW